MNIAHILPYSARFPLTKYSGRYEWVPRLARLQVANGHQVTIYAGPSEGDGSRIIWKTSANNFVYENKTLNNIALMESAFQDTRHDIYHSHFDYLQFFLADTTEKAVIYTQHWFPSEQTANAAHFNTKHNVLAVPPTHFMFEENNKIGIPSAEPIHHGIDLNLFAPSNEPPNDRLIFVGRIAPDKGVLEAVQIARVTGQKLDIVGRVKEKDNAYWQQIEPFVDGEQIKYLGAKTQPEIALLFSKAKAFIFPSKAPEAFGLVTIEAQACGTPVIISDVGASRELVDDGRSGFIAKSDSDYIEAIRNIESIDRTYCRKFAQQFDLQTMVDSYDQLYKKLVQK